ncbi:transglutaminase domain-containing protein [Microbacterium oleivorans]|uniref:transglutaminase domain-containing protein n=1 Tax=Microbacterium oleivorans TaxID=273677 RepID=UPI0009754F4E|nr:transglutaminase domain-containing protein [Microbacterium oleivorans]
MTSPTSRRDARRRRAAPSRVGFFVGQAIAVDLILAVGAVAAWPIYRSAAFVIAVCVGITAGHIVAAAGVRWRWSGWWIALAALGAYLVVGVPVAAPGSLASPDAAVRALVSVATAPVTGWKDLLTLELPLGSYQATLAPAFLLVLACAAAALSIAWRSTRWWMPAIAVALVPTAFGVVFGARSLAPPLRLGPVSLQPETLVGALAIATALVAVIWRTAHDRRRALATAAAATGVVRGGRSRGTVARTATAAGMVVVATAAAAAWGPWALAGQPRDVARSVVDPVLELERAPSPLAAYRASFTDERYDEVLFTVSAPAGIDRVRLSTLPFYDGRTVRAIDPDSGPTDPTTAFTRVPSSLTDGDANAAVVTVRMGAGAGIWVPTVGALRAVSFEGARAADLSDGFFHNAATGAAIELADGGLREEDTYELATLPEGTTESVSSLTPARSGPSLPAEVVPASLSEWIEKQEAGSGGAALETLLDRLRSRGYLSHALQLTAGETPAWLRELGGDGFQSSRAGHSADRIGALFTQLLDREADAPGGTDTDLVAAVGDDEQFAVAGMLIADQLGFDSRVVVGARLASDEDLPVCDEGACRGGDLAAWIEVQDAAGRWVPVDVTPQHESFPSPDLEQRRDPENPTDVRRDEAEPVLPAGASPADGDRPTEDAADQEADLTALWTAVRAGGISLLAVIVLVGPLVTILAVKALRRRGRRRRDSVAERFTGGWEEYVDTAVDHGYPAPVHLTRQELARLFAGEDGAGAGAGTEETGTEGAGTRLATWADRSVFDVTPPTAAENEEFWRIVAAERARFAAEKSAWARFRARLSLRSLLPRRRARRR